MFWVVAYAVFQGLGIVSAVHAITTVRTSQGAIAWAACLLTIPLLAVPLYWVFGRNKFQGMAEAFQDRSSEIAADVAKARAALAPYGKTDALGPSERSLESLTGMKLLQPNKLKLLVNGPATFDDIVAGIERAERYVLVQFYIYRSDALGRRIGDALKKRAKHGVRCHVLFDEVGSISLSSTWIREMRAAGVEVHKFDTTRGWTNRFQLNFRNHRKIVVVDGHTAWIGGHNVGVEYLGESAKRGAWRDTHVRIEGPAAIEAQGVFMGDWYWATRSLPRVTYEPRVPEGATSRVLIAPSGPSTKLETASLIAVELLHVAKERIWIATPYFIPDQAVMAALRGAALRGVDVRIMITEKCDSVTTDLASYWYLHELGGVGIRFFRYTAGFMHAKTVLVDDEVASIGTVNWDSRSFRLNFEVSALVHDDAFASQVEAMYLDDFKHCREVGSSELSERGWFFSAAVHAARLLSPIL